MAEQLRPQTLVLVCSEVTPVTGDLGVQSAGTEELNLWDLQSDTFTHGCS